MSFSWLNLKKSKNGSNLRSRFFAPELLALENRVNPTAFTANVFYNVNNIIEVQLTSVGIGANANTLRVSSIGSDTISINAGFGNTIQLSSDARSSGLVPSTNPAQLVSIISPSGSKGLTLIGNVGQDKFTLGDFNISSAGEFGISIDTSSFSGANNQDTLTIDGSVNVIGAGSFKTSNSIPTQNLDQIVITSLGEIYADTGNILLVANQGGTSNIDVSPRAGGTASLNTSSGSVTFLAGQLINIEGKVVRTNGGSIDFLSAVNLKNATELVTTGNSSASITFSSTVDGNVDLDVNSLGSLNFNGLVGSLAPLKNISTNNISGLNVNDNITADSFNTDLFNTNFGVNGNIVFNGLQTYNTTNGLNLVTNSNSNGDISINGAITMVSNAILNFVHGGALNINASITHGKFLETSVGAGSNSTVNIGDTASVSIYSDAGITFNCPVFLKTNVSLEATNNSSIIFGKTLDGPGSLSVNCTGSLVFTGKVGGSTSVGSIDTRLVGLLNFKTSDPLTLTFSDTLNVGSINAMIQGDVSMKGDQVYSGAGLSLVNLIANSTAELGNISSNATNASDVSISNAGKLNLTGDIVIGGNFNQAAILSSITLTNGGSSYTSYPDVTITSNPADTGSGAFAKASLGISSLVFNYPATGQATLGTGANSGTLASIVPLSLGYGYTTAPVVIITGGGGTGATAIAVLGTGTQTGQVVSYIITNPGSGYTTTPTINVGSNFPATAQATLGTGANSGTVGSIVPLSLGFGYITAPVVIITGGNGTGATATAVLGTGTQTGLVVSYIITNPGTGYTTAPTITVAPPPASVSGIGSGYQLNGLVTLQGKSLSNITSAYAATAKVTNISSSGAILGLDLLNPGKYDYLNSINGLNNLEVVPLSSGLGSGAFVSAVGFVNAVELVSSGSGYVSTPTVSFSGGNGSGATAFASLITPIGEVFAGVSGSTNSLNIKAGFAGNITFTTKLNLNQDLILDSSTSSLSNITLGGIESETSTAHNLALVAGGFLQFNGTVGGVNPLGAIDASSNPVNLVNATSKCLGISASSLKVISSGDINLKCKQFYSGSLASDKSSTFSVDLTNTTTNSTVNLSEINTTSQIQSILVINGGSGYTLTPTVNIAPPPAGGTQATAFANIVNGVVTSISIVNVGSGYITTPSVTITRALGDGTGLEATAVAELVKKSVRINNVGALIFNRDINIQGDFVQSGLGSVTFGDSSIVNSIVEPPKIQLNTSGGNVSFDAGVNLVQDLDINSQFGNITFNRNVNSLNGKDLSLTSGPSEPGLRNGDILLKGSLGGVNAMGDIVVNYPDDFSILGNVVGKSLIIKGVVGSVTFSGTLNTYGSTIDGTDFVSLSIETTQISGGILFQQAVTPAGNVVINNAGSFITEIKGDISSSGSFIQKGLGASFLSGDIITTTGGITFKQPVNFTGKPIFNASYNSSLANIADITFLKGVNGTGGVSLEATGKIIFKEDIGLLNPLSTIEIVNARTVEFNSLPTQTLNVNKILLTNTKGTVTFFGKSNIIDSITTASNAYNVEFKSDITVGSNANILNNGNVTFFGKATFLGTAYFNNSGFLNLSGTSLTSSGSLNVQSKINLFSNLDLFLGSASNTFGGTVSSLSGISLNLNNGSNLVLTAKDSPQFLGTIVLKRNSSSVSTLQVNGSYLNATVSLSGGKLTGTGKVKEVQNVSGGILSPGAPVGTFTISKDLTFSSTNIFSTQINGSAAGSFGQLSVAGLVSLNSASLNIPAASNLSVGQKIMIINNGASSSISGQFQGLVEGASIAVGAVTFSISYKGGTGNDVVLTVTNVVIPPPPPTYYAIGVDYGGGSVVQINYANGTNLSFFAYSPTYTGGVRVALGDVNGDGYNDLITGTGLGGGPHIKVFNLISGRPVEMVSFFAFEPNFMGGVYVASGDINADGFDDIIIGAGAGGGPRVKVIRGGSGYSMNSAVPLMDIFAFDPSFTGGVRVAAGNRDNVGGEEVITAAGYGGGPNIRSFSAVGQVIDNFFAFSTNINTGIFVGAGYVDGDGIADIIAGTGLGTPTQIAAFYSNGTRPVAVPFTSGFMGGATVGVALNSSGQQVFAAATGPGGSPVVCLLNNSLATVDSFFAINPLFSGGLFLNTSL